MNRRLRISLKPDPAMRVSRISINHRKLVYVICANRKVGYQMGSTPVVYIGTTKNGIDRFAQSAAYRADTVLRWHGVTSFEVRIITCRARQRVQTWRKLERALLLVFRDKYGQVPWCNTVGTNVEERNEFRFFSRVGLGRVLDTLETQIATGGAISD